MFGVGAILDFLRRAGLARAGVIFHRRAGRCAVRRHDGFERLNHQFIRGFANNLPHALRRVLLHHVPIAVFETIHQHRPHEPAVVCQRAHGHDHLQPRHRDPLSHRNLRDGNFAPIFHRIQNSPGFARQRNARALAKTKIPRVIVKPALTQADADLRRADVRRFRNDAFGGKNSKRFVVVQNPARKGKMPLLAIKRVSPVHGAFVQRPGYDDDLECRAGLHHVADDTIAARISGRSAGIVRIKIRQRHHRQNLARARTRDDGGDADGRVFLQRVGQ